MTGSRTRVLTGNDFLGAFKSEDEIFELVVTPGDYHYVLKAPFCSSLCVWEGGKRQ